MITDEAEKKGDENRKVELVELPLNGSLTFLCSSHFNKNSVPDLGRRQEKVPLSKEHLTDKAVDLSSHLVIL